MKKDPDCTDVDVAIKICTENGEHISNKISELLEVEFGIKGYKLNGLRLINSYETPDPVRFCLDCDFSTFPPDCQACDE